MFLYRRLGDTDRIMIILSLRVCSGGVRDSLFLLLLFTCVAREGKKIYSTKVDAAVIE